MAKVQREQTEFLATDGWVQFQNDNAFAVTVVLELWGSAGEIPAGQKAEIHIQSVPGSATTVILSPGYVQIYCADAMYVDNREIIDFRD